MSKSRSKKEFEQRERMEARFGNRPKSQPTVDFDLPAPNDNIEGSAMSEIKQTEEVINKRFRGKPDFASDFAWKNEFKRERDELRAAYESLKAKVECLEGKIELDQAKLRGEEETVKRVVAHSEALKAENEALQAEITRLQREVVNRNQRALDGDKAAKNQDALIAQLEAQAKRIAELEARESIAITHLAQVVEEMNFLMNDSQGVAGLHLNGDIAKWESLLRGGSDGSWLTYLSNAAEFVQSYRADNKGDSE